MGALIFVLCFHLFFHNLIITYPLCVIYVREDNDSNVLVIDTWLIYGLHEPRYLISLGLQKDVKLNQSLTLTRMETECQ